MFSPQELIGQKVWLSVQPEADYAEVDPIRVQAEITQPTTPPWFYARYLNPPVSFRTSGQWLSLQEAHQAFLLDPVIEYDDFEDYEDEPEDNLDVHDELNLR